MAVLIFALLSLITTALALAYALRPTGRSRRRAVIGGVLVGCMGVLGVLSALVTASASVAGLDPARQSEARVRNVKESLRSTACGLTLPVALWLVPFVVGEVRRRRVGRGAGAA